MSEGSDKAGMATGHEAPDALGRAHRRTGLVLAGVAAGMVGLSFAAVPLYRLFCQTTGYNGTTQRAAKPAGEVLARTVTVRFDANIAPGLGWRFEPVQRTQVVHVGETALAFFRATNVTDHPITGSAVFNVLPEATGAYFNKLQCFCFTEQTLQPGQSVDMPVSYFLAPDFAKDENLADTDTVTLSYTFYPVAKPTGPEKTTGVPVTSTRSAGAVATSGAGKGG